MAVVKSLEGFKFGRLSVFALAGRDKRGEAVWLCKCDCGKVIKVVGYSLRNDKTKSCGCWKVETGRLAGLRSRTHGMTKTRFYRTWLNMKSRTGNPKDKRYKDWGGRGIKVSTPWLKFDNFKADMFNSYIRHVKGFGEKFTTLDRVDNNDDYSRKNCKWSTQEEQAHNRR